MGYPCINLYGLVPVNNIEELVLDKSTTQSSNQSEPPGTNVLDVVTSVTINKILPDFIPTKHMQ
jgi:hypothetical protein